MPTISMFYGIIIDLYYFDDERDTIVANRITNEIRDVAGKVYSRDLFGSD
jgi:UDPglucose 6-dehydrogenase